MAVEAVVKKLRKIWYLGYIQDLTSFFTVLFRTVPGERLAWLS
jgi:hypothetical protein